MLNYRVLELLGGLRPVEAQSAEGMQDKKYFAPLYVFLFG